MGMADDGGNNQSSKGGTNWFLVVGALVVGYYAGNESDSKPTGAAYAETIPAADYTAAVGSLSDSDELEPPGEPVEASDDTPEVADEAVEDAANQISQTSQQYAYSYPAPATEPDPLSPQATSSASVASSTTDQVALAVAGTAVAASAAPWTRYQPSNATPTYVPPGGYAYQAPPSSAVPKCEGVGCYGATSAATGLPRTTYVSGYTRKDGTYVRPYYRSRSR